jgi:hypothetical protein
MQLDAPGEVEASLGGRSHVGTDLYASHREDWLTRQVTGPRDGSGTMLGC